MPLLPRPIPSSTLRMLSCIAAILAWNGAATTDDVGFEMANIGNPNNTADPATGLGRVERTFAISKRSVTIAECVTFLNAVAKKDRHGLYNPLMASDPMIAGIRRDGPPGNDVYSAIEPSGAVQSDAATAGGRPVTYVSWFDVARFANWMSNGQPVGPQGPTTTEHGAYRLDGAVGGTAVPRNLVNPNVGGAPNFYLPTENQWYKAAYYSSTTARAATTAMRPPATPRPAIGSAARPTWPTSSTIPAEPMSIRGASRTRVG